MASQPGTLTNRVHFAAQPGVSLRPKREQQLRREIVRTGRMMYRRGWIAANDGNITARLDHVRILATPTGMCKGRMDPDDLLGSVPLAAYGLPGTPALVDGILPFIPKYDAILLANHGAVCYGESVLGAYSRMETLEHLAQITLVAELLGGPKLLPRSEIQKLFDARNRYGIRTPNRFEPGSPVAAEDIPDPSERIEVTRQQLVEILEEALFHRLVADGPVSRRPNKRSGEQQMEVAPNTEVRAGKRPAR
jgi:Class II Aldolase and Adducin N-terminal domain